MKTPRHCPALHLQLCTTTRGDHALCCQAQQQLNPTQDWRDWRDSDEINHETLETDFRWVRERVGVDAPLETLNSTTANNDHSTMKNRLLLAKHRRLILSHLLVDFKRFGYAPNFDRSK